MIEFEPEVVGELPEEGYEKVVQLYMGPKKDIPCLLIGGLAHQGELSLYLLKHGILYDEVWGPATRGYVPALEVELYLVPGMGSVKRTMREENMIYLWTGGSGDYDRVIDGEHLNKMIELGLLPTDLEHRVE